MLSGKSMELTTQLVPKKERCTLFLSCSLPQIKISPSLPLGLHLKQHSLPRLHPATTGHGNHRVTNMVALFYLHEGKYHQLHGG